MKMEELVETMKDADCSEKEISAVVSFHDENNTSECVRRLRQHRCSLINGIHEQQKKIDCLDYLIYELQGGK